METSKQSARLDAILPGPEANRRRKHLVDLVSLGVSLEDAMDWRKAQGKPVALIERQVHGLAWAMRELGVDDARQVAARKALRDWIVARRVEDSCP